MSKEVVKKKKNASGTARKPVKPSGNKKSVKTKDGGSSKSKKKKGKRKASGKSKKGKGEKSKSKKGRSKSKHGFGKRRPPTSQQVEAYMIYTQVRARQKSLEMYTGWLKDMADQGRSLKKELQLLEEKLYARIQNVLDTTDTFVEKIRTMSATQSPYENLLESMPIPELESSENDMKSLQQTVQRLEEEYDQARKQVEKHTVEGKDFKPLESETASLVQSLIQQQSSHAEKLAHLQHKHDAAAALYSSRSNHIMTDLKRIASDREIEQMSPLSMDVVKYNRVLRREVENVRREASIVMSLVQALDTENIRLVASSAGADWNLNGVLIGQDDEDIDEAEGKADGNLSMDSESDSDWMSDSESGEENAEGVDQDILAASDEDEERDAEIGTPPEQNVKGIFPASPNARGISKQRSYPLQPSVNGGTPSKTKKAKSTQKPPPVPRTVADLAQNREVPTLPTVQERKPTRLAPLPKNTRCSTGLTPATKKQSSSSSFSSNSLSSLHCEGTVQSVTPHERKLPFRIAPLRYHNPELLNAKSVLRAEGTEMLRSGTRWENMVLALEGTAVKLTDEAPTGGARFYTSRFVSSLHAS